MDPAAALSLARTLLSEFAALTGLSPPQEPPRRYLWTDAFAVCTLLELFRRTGVQTWRQLALDLVAQVHRHLGRHRDDDPRSGWISGLDGAQGERQPTAGGLRIGKPLPERSADEAPDEQLEWERDGQYYHYLTKWMHALDRLSRVTGEPAGLDWGVELARTAHRRFSYTASNGRKRLHWKMSIDLSRPLVASMGQHDPLDGLVTCCQLRAARRDFGQSRDPELEAAIAELTETCRNLNWATDDPLGTGGLLFDACRIVQLKGKEEFAGDELLAMVLDAALVGLEAFATRSPFRLPVQYRLAFRELGLAIGVQAAQKMWRLVEENPRAWDDSLRRRLEALRRYFPFGERIEAFWADETVWQAETWLAHREINMVMLATSLAPEAFLSV